MITADDVAFHVLLDLGVPRERVCEFAERLSGCRSIEEAIGRVVSLLGQQLGSIDVQRITTQLRAYQNIAVIDFSAPSVKRSRALNRAEVRGGFTSREWRALPHVVVTRIEVEPRARVPDRRHSGYEFLFLESGSGVFRLDGAGEVTLAKGIRQFLAYRPTRSHSFTANDGPAVLYVVSYSRPETSEECDPAVAILHAAKRTLRVVARHEPGDTSNTELR